MSLKIGKAKYGITQKKYFKLKDGDSAFRILPPIGDLADKGVWSMFYKIHYGYKNSQGKLRVFQSSLVKNKKGMIEVPDAAAARINDLKAKLEEAKAAGNKAVVEKLGPLVSGQKPMYNLDSNHYMNVIDSQGNIGILKLRHRAKVALDVQIKKLREKNIDPLSVDNGRFFVFTRSGSGLDTSFQVEIMKKDIEVPGVGTVQQEVVHKLNDELISRLGQEAAQLDKLFKALSADEIEQIVKRSDLLTGKSPAIDELMDSKGSGSDDNDPAAEGEEEEPTQSGVATGANSASSSGTQASSNVTTATAQSTTKTEAAAQTVAKPQMVETKQEAAVATQQLSETVAPKVTNPVQTTAEAVTDMSDADFLKSLGL